MTSDATAVHDIVTTRDHFTWRGPVGLRVDVRTGLPVALLRRDTTPDVALNLSLTLVTGGREELGPVGGLIYNDTERIALDDLTLVRLDVDDAGPSSQITAHTSAADGWQLDLHYRLDDHSPHIGIGVTVRRAPGADDRLLRDVELTLTVPLERPQQWILNAPGNQCRADLPVDALSGRPLIVRGAGEGEGSTGLVALSRADETQTLVMWPLCQTEVGQTEINADHECLQLALTTGMAGRVSPHTGGLTWQWLYLDSEPDGWPQLRDRLGDWWRHLGVQAPSDGPDWLTRAHIYEAYIGFAVFADGQRMQRYATVAALREDLPRIIKLGFDVLQLMPRHPYPSYNVHDYADITTTYGDEDELRALVHECHQRGMLVLLDVILHGVIDKEVVDETVAAVHAGPYADRLTDGTIDYLSRFPEDIGWARHIAEYGAYWRDGAPDRHPLPDQHPDWFMRDSTGRITRRYTKAFDVSHPEWQAYFIQACCDLVERLGVDGFRVDAPTYNDFGNWTPGDRIRASFSAMAPLTLLRDLRTRLRDTYGDIAVYTEPTGSLWRAAADATYNYDEHWLVESLLDAPHPAGHDRLVTTGADLARWLQDRDASLPPGACIVHHVDSHDSIWWRLPGEQWRLERFGADATTALVAVQALLGGAYMTFMGGEAGVERALRTAHRLRRSIPEIVTGAVDYAAARASRDEILTAVRWSTAGRTLIAVNLAATPVTSDVTFSGPHTGRRVRDLWNDEWITPGIHRDRLRLAFAPFQARVIRIATNADDDRTET